MEKSVQKKISPEQIEYIAFRGGGGKGIAYLGALAGLAEVGLLQKKKVPTRKKEPFEDYVINRDKIKGVAGASAGAITATLFALGYSLTEILDFSTNTDLLTRFFDDANPQMRPSVNKSQTNDNLDFGKLGLSKKNSQDGQSSYVIDLSGPEIINLNISGLDLSSCKKVSTETKKSVIEYVKEFFLFNSAIPALVGPILFSNLLTINYADSKLRELIKPILLQLGLPSSVADRILEQKLAYVRNLFEDYGLFSGAFSRRIFALLIALKMDGNADATFDDFRNKFHMDLILTGTNLVKGECVYFGTKGNTDFKLVDALRISMSIPPAFKPIIIDDPSLKNYWGVWTDGGVTNNIPIHAFDNPDPSGKGFNDPFGGKFNENLLGLSLASDPDEDTEITSLSGYLSAISSSLQNLANDGQFRSDQEREHTKVLPTVFEKSDGMKGPRYPSAATRKNKSKLSTYNFTPDESTVGESIWYSYKAIMEYFAKEINPYNNITFYLNKYMSNFLQRPPRPIQPYHS